MITSPQVRLARMLRAVWQADPSAPLISDAVAESDECSYDVRNRRIWQALGLAADIGYPCGIRADPDEPDWPVVYIELPSGQVSWHMPIHEREWDRHDTVTKYRRIGRYMQTFGRGDWA